MLYLLNFFIINVLLIQINSSCNFSKFYFVKYLITNIEFTYNLYVLYIFTLHTVPKFCTIQISKSTANFFIFKADRPLSKLETLILIQFFMQTWFAILLNLLA